MKYVNKRESVMYPASIENICKHFEERQILTLEKCSNTGLISLVYGSGQIFDSFQNLDEALTHPILYSGLFRIVPGNNLDAQILSAGNSGKVFICTENNTWGVLDIPVGDAIEELKESFALHKQSQPIN